MKFDDEGVAALRKDIQNQVKESLKKQSQTKLPKMDLLFDQIYDKPTENLERQKKELYEVVNRYPDLINVDRYESN